METSETTPVKVAVAEDSLIIREGLVRLLEEAGFEVVGSYSTADDLLREIGTSEAALAILDVRMPPTFTDEGIRAAIRIRAERPDMAILILSQYVAGVYARELFAQGEGGIGYLLKENVLSLESLRSTVLRLIAGQTELDPEVVSALITARRDPLAALTPREREVLGLMAEGLTNKEIAERGTVGLGTVEKQVNAVFAKLGLALQDGGHRRVLAVLTWLQNAA